MAVAHIARLLVATVLAVGLAAAPSPTQLPIAPAGVQAASLPPWTGNIDLYRPGTFSTQKTYLWCTAAGVQIARNIVRGGSDHSRANQSLYFDWMRARNRYDIPVSDGVDPQGWAAGMRNFVDGRYRLATSRSYTSALRSAATSLRLTNLPVGVLVSHGAHAWLMTGFSATADPATARNFTVTSVRVVGPLFGLQSRNGYDMPPNTSLSAAAFKRFFTPWHYAGIRMVWEGLYGTVQGTPARADPVSEGAGSLQPPIPALTRPMPSAREGANAVAPAASAAADVQPSPRSGFGPDATQAATGGLPVGAVLLPTVTLLALGSILLAARSRRRRSHRQGLQSADIHRHESDFG